MEIYADRALDQLSAAYRGVLADVVSAHGYRRGGVVRAASR